MQESIHVIEVGEGIRLGPLSASAREACGLSGAVSIAHLTGRARDREEAAWLLADEIDLGAEAAMIALKEGGDEQAKRHRVAVQAAVA